MRCQFPGCRLEQHRALYILRILIEFVPAQMVDAARGPWNDDLRLPIFTRILLILVYPLAIRPPRQIRRIR